ncbi:MAG: PKD domain-containing protein, partial [Candidatus Wallbacteria bacterium]|nr:PKD domain-containing protein [Candidatus Wallbacteria bacterium]
MGRSKIIYWLPLLLCCLLPPTAAWGLEGDLDGSGRVDAADLMALARAFGASRGEPRFDERADLNADGRVGAADLEILRANFARVGRHEDVWVADGGAAAVLRLNPKTGVVRLRIPIDAPTRLAADPADGGVWVACGATRLRRYSAAGDLQADVSGFGRIESLSTEPATTCCWVADPLRGELLRVPASLGRAASLATAGDRVRRIVRMSGVKGAALDSRRGVLWAAGADEGPLFRFDANAPSGYDVRFSSGFHLAVAGLSGAAGIAVDATDGSAAASDPVGRQASRFFSSGVGLLFDVSGFLAPAALAFDPLDGSLWIADSGGALVRLDRAGAEVLRVEGVTVGARLSVEPLSGDVWVAEPAARRLRRFSAAGKVLLESNEVRTPNDVAALPGDAVFSAPSPVGSAEPAVCAAGQPVTFSVAMLTPGTQVASVELDFDGDGAVDLTRTAPVAVTHSYSFPGVYAPSVRVVNTRGLAGQDSSLVVRVGGLAVTLGAERVSGDAPFTANLIASGSNPRDGRFSRVEWDLDGDGTFEHPGSLAAGTRSTMAATYLTPGAVRPVVRVSDAAGNTATAGIALNVGAGRPSVTLQTSAQRGTAPLTVSLAPKAASPFVPVLAYRWDYTGDGSSVESYPDGRAVQFTYTRGGAFSPSVTVSDSLGRTAAASVTVVVTGPPGVAPTVLASATPREGFAPLTVAVSGAASISEGRVTTYRWSFGDGQESPQDLLTPSLSHTYNSAGTFAARLTAISDRGVAASNVVSIAVAASEVPRPVASASPSSGFAPLAVQFQGTAIAAAGRHIASYEWDFTGHALFAPESVSTTAGDAAHTYSSPGDYFASLRTTDDAGKSALARVGVHVSVPNGTGPVPVIDAFFAGSNYQYAPFSTTLSAAAHVAGAGPLLYEWDIDGDGVYDQATEAQLTLPVTYRFGGTFSPRLRVSTPGGQRAERTTNLTVYAAAPTFAGAAAPLAGTVPLTVTYTSHAQSDPENPVVRTEVHFGYGANYLVFSSPSADVTTRYVYTFRSVFSSYIRVFTRDGGFGDRNFDLNLQLSSDPTATFAVSATIGPAPLTVHFDASASSPGVNPPASYRWDFESDSRVDTALGPSPLATHTYTRPGRYSATLEVRSRVFDPSFASKTIDVGEPFAAAPSAFPTRGVAPLTVRLTPLGRPKDSAIDRYEWDVDADGNVDRTDLAAVEFETTFFRAGVYRPRLRVVASDGRSDLRDITIIVDEPAALAAQLVAVPSAGGAPLAVQLAAGLTTGMYPVSRVDWDFDGNGVVDLSVSGTRPVSFTYSTPGVYRPAARVFDKTGRSGQATATVLVGSVPRPVVRVEATSTEGDAPLAVMFTAVPGAAPPGSVDGRQFVWDFDGDGRTDLVVASAAPVKFIYRTPGRSIANLAVVSEDGTTVTTQRTILVRPAIRAECFPDSFSQGGPRSQTRVDVSCGSGGALDARVIARDGAVVRRLAVALPVQAGVASLAWDGTDDQGRLVLPGVYFAVAELESGGIRVTTASVPRPQVLASILGLDYAGSADSVTGRPVTVRLRLDKASEVSAYVIQFSDPRRLPVRTLLLREPLGAGDHEVDFDGADDAGLALPAHDTYSMAAYQSALPSNAVVVYGPADPSVPAASPAEFTPSPGPYAFAPPIVSHVRFHVAPAARVGVDILDFDGNVVDVLG